MGSIDYHKFTSELRLLLKYAKKWHIIRGEMEFGKWEVGLKGQAKKASKNLPKKTHDTFMLLLFDLEKGPIKHNWPNYSALKGVVGHYHCHIEKGRPTYVACWTADKKTKTIEVYYAGTHEQAPY